MSIQLYKIHIRNLQLIILSLISEKRTKNANYLAADSSLDLIFFLFVYRYLSVRNSSTRKFFFMHFTSNCSTNLTPLSTFSSFLHTNMIRFTTLRNHTASPHTNEVRWFRLILLTTLYKSSTYVEIWSWVSSRMLSRVAYSFGCVEGWACHVRVSL